MSGFEEKLVQVKHVINDALHRSGRKNEKIEIMAVTKTLPITAVAQAVEAGIGMIGENRVQEALGKIPARERGYRLHLIGHLQRNKAKYVPGFFDCVESIDKLETAAALDRYCREKETSIDVLLEMNTSGEETKSGFTSADDLKRTVEGVLDLESLRLTGLMTIAPFTDDTGSVRKSFATLRTIFEEVLPEVDKELFTTLSMGMSSDYGIAIEEGSTRVRLGTALFGSRA